MGERLPLEGVRVADLSIWLQGPLASAILGHLGAEVIKIEKPGLGDFARGCKRMFKEPLILPDGRNLLWETGNPNKKGIAIDLQQLRGREVFYRLIQKCEVMVTNLSPRALRQLGADKETVVKRNPGLIYAQATGFGHRGPHAEDPCQDTAGMARAGFLFSNPTPEGEPTYPPGALSDVMSATMLAFGVVTALLGKERMGRASAVFASQVSSMMWLGLFPIALYTNIGREYGPFERTDVGNPLMNIYRCGDGKWFALGLFMSDRWWHDLCGVMDLRHLEHDPRFATEDDRAEYRKELIVLLDRAFASQPRAEWERRFREKGLWCSVVNRYSDLASDPQVQANEYLITLDNGIKATALPFELDGVAPRRRGAPELGQQTEDVLREVCGYSGEEILALKTEGVVA